MNKKLLGNDLSRVVNRTAQSLAARSFHSIRADLEAEAIDMLTQGQTRQEIARVMVAKDILGGFKRVEPSCDLA